MKNKNLDFGIHLLLLILPFINLMLYLKGVYGFRLMAEIYLANLVLLAPLFILDWKRKQYTGFWVFSLTFFYSLPWMFLGFDMTDESYSLSIAWFYPRIETLISQKAPISYLLTHWWLRIVNTPYFLWERIVVNIVLALILYFSYKTLEELNSKLTNKWLPTIIVFFAFGVLSYNWYRYLVPYDKIPMLLTIIFFYLWLAGFNRQNKWLLFGAGVFLILAMYSRITLFFLMPLIPVLSILHGRARNKNLVYVAAGILAGIIFIMISPVKLTHYIADNINILLKHYSSDVCIVLDKSHTPGRLLHNYLKESLTVFKYIIVILFIIAFSEYGYKNKYGTKIDRIFLTILLITLVFFAIYKFHYPHSSVKWFYSTFALEMSSLLILLVKKFKTLVKDFDVILTLFLIMAMAFAGSNVGLRKIHFNFALAYVMPIFIGIGYEKIHKNILWISLFFLATMGFLLNKNYVYRDYGIKSVNTHFTTGPAKGLWTIKTKIKEVDNFNHKIHKYLEDKNFLTIHKTYFFALANNKLPCALCWSVNPQGLKKAIENGKLQYVIMSTTSMRRYDWNKKRYLAVPVDMERIKQIQKILDSSGTVIAHSPHNIFVLYKIKHTEKQ